MRVLIIAALASGAIVVSTPVWCETEAQNKADDQQCQSYGAKPGSDTYVNCRLKLVQMRQDRTLNEADAVPPPPSAHAELDAAMRRVREGNAPSRPRLHCETISDGWYARQTNCQ